jgi:hypothetical protein
LVQKRKEKYEVTDKMGFECACCGKYHDELPMSYGSPAPAYWHQIEPAERENRCELTSDICVIDNEFYFIRGCIEIPVVDYDGPFIWDVWVSLSKENFKRTLDYWDKEGRERELKPMFGWLSTSIPCYPQTLNLKTMVHTREVGIRPFIELEPTEHPLAVEQREGIYMARVREIAEELCSRITEREREKANQS